MSSRVSDGFGPRRGASRNRHIAATSAGSSLFSTAVSEQRVRAAGVETVRSLLLGTPMSNNGWIALAWCCGLLLFSFLLATSLYRRRTRR
jgi:hypothetical protein